MRQIKQIQIGLLILSLILIVIHHFLVVIFTISSTTIYLFHIEFQYGMSSLLTDIIFVSILALIFITIILILVDLK